MLPNSWTKYEQNSAFLPASGYATYRLQIYISEDIKPPSLYIYRIASNYVLSVNKNQVLEIGQYSIYPEQSIAKHKPVIVDLGSAGTEIELEIQVSNFDDGIAGLTNPILLGRKDLLERQRLIEITYEIMILGALCVILGFSIIGYLGRKEETAYLYNSILALLSILYIFSMGTQLLPDLLGFTRHHLLMKINFSSFALSLTFLMLYMKATFPQEVHWAVPTACTVHRPNMIPKYSKLD